MNALEIRDLSKTYKGKRWKSVNALSGLNLLIPAGQVFGFLGPNGAGKSTTIKSIMGHVKPTSGSVHIFGEQSSTPAARRKIGYLPETPSFYDFMTAREYLSFVGRAFSMTDGQILRESKKILGLLDLHDAADRPLRGFSKGMIQRLGLAQALLHDPDLYVLDEPMSGLDPLGRALVKDIIKGLKARGKTVFFSTHITADIEVICDRVGVITGGKLMAVDSVENILNAGIEGYSIQFSRQDGTQEEVVVEKDKLKDFLQSTADSDISIERIEPKRRDMEAFFLDIVRKERHANQ